MTKTDPTPDALVEALRGILAAALDDPTRLSWANVSDLEWLRQQASPLAVDIASELRRHGWHLRAAARTLGEPDDPDPNCPKCHGTGEAPNPQFSCPCRWRHLREACEAPPAPATDARTAEALDLVNAILFPESDARTPPQETDMDKTATFAIRHETRTAVTSGTVTIQYRDERHLELELQFLRDIGFRPTRTDR